MKNINQQLRSQLDSKLYCSLVKLESQLFIELESKLYSPINLQLLSQFNWNLDEQFFLEITNL